METKTDTFENPVDMLRRTRAEQAILAQTRWAALHDYVRYDDVKDKFNNWAKGHTGTTYDAQLAKAPEAHLIFSESVLPLLRPASEILDVGCGTGLAGAPLIASGHTVDGVDISPGMLGKTKERGYRTAWQQNIVHGINTRERQYDALISVGVFGEYVPPVLALQHALPHLKQRAVVAFTTEKTSTYIDDVFDVLWRHRFIHHTPLEQAVYGERKACLAPQMYYYVTAARM